MLSRTVTGHWPEYVIEGSGLGLFMISACGFGTLFGHPDSPVVRLIRNPTLLRVLMGLAMGSTAVSLIYSRFGKRSGAHMNPATTLTFLRLGKIEAPDALLYMTAQFLGAVIGVMLAGIFLGVWLSHPSVNYVVTLPGRYGRWWAFAAEVAMTFVLMSVILRVSNIPKLNRYTGILAGILVATYISVEAPISGMSMNPARTLGSAVFAANWTAIWIYFTAPLLGMMLAAQVYLGSQSARRVLCAKLHHDNDERCIFRCNYPERQEITYPLSSGGMPATGRTVLPEESRRGA
jgi:aquaporin Z